MAGVQPTGPEDFPLETEGLIITRWLRADDGGGAAGRRYFSCDPLKFFASAAAWCTLRGHPINIQVL